MPIHGHAAYAAKETLKRYEYQPGELGLNEVEVRVDFCGICHSDIHLIDDDWGMSRFPFIPGHEIIGSVAAVGTEVSRFTLGQRVGIGWLAGSCMECEWCIRGEDNLCLKPSPTCVGRNGGYAELVRADSRFAFTIPEQLDSAAAAPLLCGGVTVYSPLRNLGVKPWHTVGVIGIGGLGHLAIKFARAFGCEVIAFSTSLEKEKESKTLGAHRFVLGSDPDRLSGTANSCDFILSTAHTDLDWNGYVRALRTKGTLCVVGAPPEALLNVPAVALLLQEKRLCGSAIGSRATIQEMLTFAARHRIGATVEVMPMPEVNAALDHVRSGKARYRVVLKT